MRKPSSLLERGRRLAFRLQHARKVPAEAGGTGRVVELVGIGEEFGRGRERFRGPIVLPPFRENPAQAFEAFRRFAVGFFWREGPRRNHIRAVDDQFNRFRECILGGGGSSAFSQSAARSR